MAISSGVISFFSLLIVVAYHPSLDFWNLTIKASGAKKPRSGFGVRTGPPCYADYFK